jgi:septum formation protein
MSQTLYLASASPRRAALVRLLGITNIEVQASGIDEPMHADLSPAENVRTLALHKARHIAEPHERGIVLGADTTVVINGEVLEKPRDAEDAFRMLRLLSGDTHTVYTGVALINAHTKKEEAFVESTDVTFRPLADDEIRSYIASGSPMDKAGAYGIQDDFGAVFVRHIDGDYYNVVGLPLCRLFVTLKKFAPELFA